ncbi:hypothetical protein [Streptomyces sp. NPDC047079]|uniref:hypothetical protein n=1 Tax=Streptomyces sp. NPDC047079 TaxID=3154607 RepID=UPI0033D63CC1
MVEPANFDDFSTRVKPNFHTAIKRRPEVKLPPAVTWVSPARRPYVPLGQKWVPSNGASHTFSKKFVLSL